jgi:hypothetical protein
MIIYNEIVTAQTPGRKCHHCNEKIERGTQYLHMTRNKHIYNICGKCLILLSVVMNDEHSVPVAIQSSKGNRGITCNQCADEVIKSNRCFKVRRNRHTFVLCAECFIDFSNTINACDPIHKAEAMAELI